jgi:hypothetical protein
LSGSAEYEAPVSLFIGFSSDETLTGEGSFARQPQPLRESSSPLTVIANDRRAARGRRTAAIRRVRVIASLAARAPRLIGIAATMIAQHRSIEPDNISRKRGTTAAVSSTSRDGNRREQHEGSKQRRCGDAWTD